MDDLQLIVCFLDDVFQVQLLLLLSFSERQLVIKTIDLNRHKQFISIFGLEDQLILQDDDLMN